MKQIKHHSANKGFKSNNDNIIYVKQNLNKRRNVNVTLK